MVNPQVSQDQMFSPSMPTKSRKLRSKIFMNDRAEGAQSPKILTIFGIFENM
jgi:hypothetical protein